MLKIRPEHMNALAKQQVAGFTARMVLHLREVFPAEVAGLDDAKLRLLLKSVRPGTAMGHYERAARGTAD